MWSRLMLVVFMTCAMCKKTKQHVTSDMLKSGILCTKKDCRISQYINTKITTA